ncbi:MAG: insulinase family protein [Deltaproteobacteria bacterium]|nr:insulinase family protein [Deltaproteobacteria bacterium]
MKNIIQLLFVALVLFYTHSLFALDPKISEITQKQLPIIAEPEINITTLSNGVKLYYLQDNELPIIKIKSFFETGLVYESKDQRGLTSFFMSAWQSGGAKGLSPEKVDEELEFISASLMGTEAADLASMTLICLQKDLKTALDIYFNVLKNPDFEQSRIDVIKKNILDGIQRRNEEPLSILNREFLQALFGKDSVYAWMSTPETINVVKRETLFKFYADNIAPNRMLIAASAPLSFDAFVKLIEGYLSDWRKTLPPKNYPPEIQKKWEKSVGFIHKQGNQSSIALGHFGERRFNKDKYKLILADEILGGSTFGSKLGDKLRTDLGLVYSIMSSFGFERDYGSFRMVTQTKSESTFTAIDAIKKIIDDMVKNKNITEAELFMAKERILNRLVFEYETPFNIVTRRVIYDYHGYPPNYISLYQKEISQVKLADIKEILDKYFFPDQLKVMIVGDRDKIPGLKEYEGLVETPLDEE